ncbi:MAG TPA: alkaline phosphatase family protein [Dermatophilaceae bacterium]|nr:alkaline phosphatase family protein [Dermatophilaceae bacterium]
MSALSPSERARRRQLVVAALTSQDLAGIVDLVVWVEGDSAVAANATGTVELRPDGSVAVRSGTNPIASQDPMAFLPYPLELASPAPATSRANAYPYAARRIRSLFADPSRSPDVAVVHTPRHRFLQEGGHVGEHGSLDVIQSRAPLLLSGPGVAPVGLVDDHARLVDVGPTLAVLAGVPAADLADAFGDPLDGAELAAYLRLAELPDPPVVVGMLWDGAHCGELLRLAEGGELRGVARLLDRGVALRGGAVAEFPSVTLTNHASILTGVGPGRHGVLGNVFYDRETGERVVPNDAATWHRSAQWLRPGVRTVFELVNTAVATGTGPGGADTPRTAAVDEAVDRGADYSTMALVRASGGADGAAGLDGLLPDASQSPNVSLPAALDDAYYRWGTRVDDAGLQQMLQLFGGGVPPRLTWWSTVVTDAGHHGGGPRSELATASLRDADTRLCSFLAHLERAGLFHQVSFLLTADHGFEGTDPGVTGSWRPALDALGLPYRDEGPGFVYLLADRPG